MTTIEALRQYRIASYAIFDLAVTFIAMALLAPLLSMLFLKIGISIPKKNWLFLALPLGVVVHLLFGTMTQMTKDFLDPSGHFALKLVLLVCVILGFWGIKLVKHQ